MLIPVIPLPEKFQKECSLICGASEVNSLNKYNRGITRASYGISPGMYGIYRLAVNQSSCSTSCPPQKKFDCFI